MTLKEVWTASFLASLVAGASVSAAEERADQALAIYCERWPDGEEARDGS